MKKKTLYTLEDILTLTVDIEKKSPYIWRYLPADLPCKVSWKSKFTGGVYSIIIGRDSAD